MDLSLVMIGYGSFSRYDWMWIFILILSPIFCQKNFHPHSLQFCQKIIQGGFSLGHIQPIKKKIHPPLSNFCQKIIGCGFSLGRIQSIKLTSQILSPIINGCGSLPR